MMPALPLHEPAPQAGLAPVSLLEQRIRQHYEAPRIRKQDEWEEDFDDNRISLTKKWEQEKEQWLRKASTDQREEFRLLKDLRTVAIALRDLEELGAYEDDIKGFLSVCNTLSVRFQQSMQPEEIDFAILWASVYGMIESMFVSELHIHHVIEMMDKARVKVTIFNSTELEATDYEQRRSIFNVLKEIFNFSYAVREVCRRYVGPKDFTAEWDLTRGRLEMIMRRIDKQTNLFRALQEMKALKIQQRAENRLRPVKLTGHPQDNRPHLFPFRYIPLKRYEGFYGRRHELEEIGKVLTPGGEELLKTFTVYGARGVGKSMIALEFAYQNEPNYDAIFWISCETLASIRQSFFQAALELKLPGATDTDDPDQNRYVFQEWLELTRMSWLLIFDNAEDKDPEMFKVLQRYMPTSYRGSILFTSRQADNFSANPDHKGLTVPAFDNDEAVKLLINLLSPAERAQSETPEQRQAAQKLMNYVEGLPLAIQQIASLVGVLDVSLAEFEQILVAELVKLPTLDPEFEPAPSKKALHALFAISINRLKPEAATTLSVMCLVAPESLPIKLFSIRPQPDIQVPDHLHFCLPEGGATVIRTSALPPKPSQALNTVIEELTRASLIRPNDQQVSLHRVTQEAFLFGCRHYGITGLQQAFEDAAFLLYLAFPVRINGRRFADRLRCERYIQHCLALGEVYSDLNSANVAGETLSLKPVSYFAPLLSHAAWYLYEQGLQKSAQKLAIIGISTLSGGEVDGQVLASLYNTLGCSKHEENRWSESRKNLQRALDIRSNIEEISPEEMANSWNNLANVCDSERNFTVALEYHTRAGEIRMEASEAHPEALQALATSYLSQGRTLRYLGRFDEALSKLEDADALFQDIHGGTDMLRAFVYFEYGNVRLVQAHLNSGEARKESLKSARTQYLAALNLLSAKALLITASCYYRLGCVQEELGHCERAKISLDRAQQFAELRASSENDGSVARIMNRKASIIKQLQDLEKDQEAEYAAPESRLRPKKMENWMLMQEKAEAMQQELERELFPSEDDTALFHRVLNDAEAEGRKAAKWDLMVASFYR